MASNKQHDNRGIGPGDQESLKRLAHGRDMIEGSDRVTGSGVTTALRREPDHAAASGKRPHWHTPRNPENSGARSSAVGARPTAPTAPRVRKSQ